MTWEGGSSWVSQPLRGGQWFSGQVATRLRYSPARCGQSGWPRALEQTATSENLFLGDTCGWPGYSSGLSCSVAVALTSGTVPTGGMFGQHLMGSGPICTHTHPRPRQETGQRRRRGLQDKRKNQEAQVPRGNRREEGGTGQSEEKPRLAGW